MNITENKLAENQLNTLSDDGRTISFNGRYYRSDRQY